MKKMLVLPVLGLTLVAFAAPAMAECSWSKQQTTEKPKETVEDPSA